MGFIYVVIMLGFGVCYLLDLLSLEVAWWLFSLFVCGLLPCVLGGVVRLIDCWFTVIMFVCVFGYVL